ncbi:MAG TPA: amino acid adenylation domain-containing protein [Pyrinomonadaceae bacterium]
MAGHLRTLLEAVAVSADASIAHLPLLTETELRLLISERNETAADYPRDACLHQLFEQQVEKTPDALALVFKEERLTYGELNRRANQLAHHLKNLGVGPEVRVGIMMERSTEMIVALLGIMKAGGAYVPLDPSYPSERLAFMIDDAAVPILLTEERHLDKAFAQLVVCPDMDWHLIAGEATDNPSNASDADNLAYVIYTSGSTGQPKGVCVSHRAVNRLVFNTNYVSLDHTERVAQVSNSSFDAATFEIWGALLHGAELVIIERDVALSPHEFAAEILERSITTMFLTTALFNQLARVVPSAFGSLRNLLFGGEAVDAKWVREILRNNPPARLLHVYGPTESTTFTTWYGVEDVAENATTVPIGCPISNTQTYLLDAQLEPVPEGIAGELFIGGCGLARGYQGEAALTAEKFIPDPFGSEAGGRLYRTGDLARYGPEGMIEFVGRRDQQVKIRGFRIELEEIKTMLGEHEAVRECLVLVREDVPGDKRLVAYLLAAQPEPPGVAELRKHLREKLPDYMTPSAFVWLNEFPLTANGKIDREALPAPEHPPAERLNAYVAPRTPAEEALAAIIADVLGVERIGVYDNFFELGGHSLLATQVITRIREVMGVDVSLKQFFESPLIDELASQIEPLMTDGPTKTVSPMRVVSKARALPLSFAQQRLWFLDQFESGNPIYNIPIALSLRGHLDVEALERTLNEIVRRHESLRTVFRAERGEPVQVVLTEQPVAVSVLNLAGLLKADAEMEAERLAASEAQKGFDLARGPLLRATLLRLSEEDHVLLFTMHHIISDGWSMGVLVHEMGTIYAAYAAGRKSPLEELPIQYADFAQWQREWLQGEVLEEQLAYWKKQLARLPPVLELPTDRARPAALSYRGATLNVEFNAALTDKLKELSRREGASLYMILLAAFQTLLHRYTGRDDITVGSPIANRQRSEIEPLIGFFVNTLVMRTDLSGDPAFRELLRRVQQTTLSAYEHQDLPFETLVEELQPERHLGVTPFFQVVFALQNAPGQELRLPHLTLARMDVPGTTAKFDLSLLLEESAERLIGVIEYSTDLFDEKTVGRLLEHLRILLESIVANPDERLSALPLLAAAEEQQLIARCNSADAEAELRWCVQHLFEQRAEETPDHAAVILGEQELSYRELNRRANLLAHHLQAYGVGPDVVVAVMMERSVEMALSVLAVMKAGGACLLLDPADPRERLSFMLRNAAARVLLAQKHLERLLTEDIYVCCPDDDEDWQAIAQGKDENPHSRAMPDNLACLVYTSGSTVEPKAVAIHHGALVNLIGREMRSAGTTGGLRTLQLAPPGPDLAFLEIFSTWCSGGALVLAPSEARKDSRELWRILSSENIERLFLPSARLRHLAESARAETILPQSLRQLILTGEQLKITEQVRGLFAKLPHCAIDYEYGPTEAQLSTRWRLEGLADEQSSLPSIGSPYANAQVFILDSRLKPVPEGIAGELYIGGPGLAREYLNRADLTASRFIPHPFSLEAGARLYRTGDVARYLSDGRLKYLRHTGNRMMLRGYCVEMEEVESALELHPAVKQALVNPWEDEAGRAHLVAYVIAAQRSQSVVAELRGHLRERLPDYMMPSAFLLLDSFPLLPNGRPDRRALPAPVQAEGEVKESYVAPQTPTEEILAGIWSTVLKVERVGINDNFFDLGGHSLLATQLMSGVSESFGVELPLRRLFEHPTVADLAESIEESLRDRQGLQVSVITRVARDAHLPLSFAQQRLWFIHQLEPNNPTYHIASAIKIKGSLAVEALEQSLAEIVRRHEVLRTSFVVIDGQPVQVIAPDARFTLPVVDLSDRMETEREAEKHRLMQEEARRAFDLRESPLLRARLLRLGSDDHVMLLVMHHIISDGWSVGVMVRELAALYEAHARGLGSPLPELTVQYADFAVWQRERLTGEFVERQLDYWREQLAGAPPVLDLPTTRTRRGVQTFRGANVPLDLSQELTESLRALCRSEDATLFMMLLGAFQLLLWRYTQQRDILVGTPIAGRTRSELEPLIGCFVNTLVLRTRLVPEESFRELMRRVREVCLGGYAHQEVPFERVVEEIAPERSLSHAPLFQVMFALQNAPMPSLELGHLKLTLADIPLEVSRFDLTLVLEETEGGLSGLLEYNTDLFDADAMARMLGHYRRLLESITADAERPLSGFDLLAEAERRQLLIEWNDTASGIEQPFTADQLFEQRVEQQPDALAVKDGDVRLTYAELNHRANQLAHHLRALGAGPDTPVCICIERSAALVVSILAVVKAGGAYVPLDPSYPLERLSFMLKDSRAPVLLTREGLRETFKGCEAEVVLLDREWDTIARRSVDNQGCCVMPANLAYVIYTSGSTGQPKGVAIAHSSLVNMIGWYQRTSAVTPGEKFTLISGVGFDASVFELWPNLVSGASCHIPDDETRLSPEKLRDWLVAERINSCFVPTPLAELLLALPWPTDAALRLLHTGGDKLHRFPDKSFGFRVMNHYGPTESTVIAASGCVGPEEESLGQSPSIGRPVDNAEAYLLDQTMQPAPIGIRGELYVGGAGLARGYLHRPEWTAESFIPHPFSASPGERLYRTGDLARYLPDGQIEFIGRIDGQVKIRGHRIELGEIEVVLNNHLAIRESVVDCRETRTGEKRLTAYLVAEAEAHPSVDELRTYLGERLPGYMIPSAFMFLSSLPLNANGKVDRQALPYADALNLSTGTAYVAPVTKMERTIAALWRELLGLERVGVDDNFFDLGGHSLLMILMQSKLQETLEREIAIIELFQYPTVGALARHLSREPSIKPEGVSPHRQRGDARRQSIRGRARRTERQPVAGQ